jgi:hypothetical protein
MEVVTVAKGIKQSTNGDGELSPKEKEFLQLVAEFLV